MQIMHAESVERVRELGTNSEVIWELVTDEQAGLYEEKKKTLCSWSILQAALIIGLLWPSVLCSGTEKLTWKHREQTNPAHCSLQQG